MGIIPVASVINTLGFIFLALSHISLPITNNVGTPGISQHPPGVAAYRQLVALTPVRSCVDLPQGTSASPDALLPKS